MINIFTSIILFFFTLSYPLFAEFRGYNTLQSSVGKSQLQNARHSIDYYQFDNINRLNYIYDQSKNLVFEFGFELTQVYDFALDRQFLVNREQQSFNYRFWDPTPAIIHSKSNENKSYYLLLNLDRFMLTGTWNNWEYTIGRQQINFGPARIINPIDVLTPFDLTTINTEERNGVDAIRLRHPIGEMGEWDLGVVWGRHLRDEKNAYYISSRLTFDRFDLIPILIRFYQAKGLGLGYIHTIGGANLWIESLHVIPKKDSSYFRVSLGSEYQWSSSLLTAIEYHFNGVGETKAQSYPNVSTHFGLNHGGVFLVGKNYLNFLAQYQLHALHGLMGLLYLNLDDYSVLVSPNWTWNLSENMNFILGAFLGIGKKSSTPYIPQSEFGLYPETIFVKLIKYF